MAACDQVDHEHVAGCAACASGAWSDGIVGSGQVNPKELAIKEDLKHEVELLGRGMQDVEQRPIIK